MATLINESGRIDKNVYLGALNAKFPKGTKLEPFLAYVKEVKGECHDSNRKENALWCEIPTFGGFCFAGLIGIQVESKDNLIEGFEINVGALGC